METFSYQHLAKLENLERILSNLLEKVDNEINQTEVEWLHLKSIAEAEANRFNSNVTMLSTTDISLKNQVQAKMNAQSLTSNIGYAKMKEESIDDHAINFVKLNLSPIKQNCFSGITDEEFDSD